MPQPSSPPPAPADVVPSLRAAIDQLEMSASGIGSVTSVLTGNPPFAVLEKLQRERAADPLARDGGN